ncbi:type IV secretion system DNA-binding domain-containing protein, partial [Enterococcus faecium]|uniref:type IV secretion system DNA-binding domain-containing protein n=1 Tax=Enterococcus faecium TaxID=1352 RepID=UPI003F43C5B2
YYRPERDFILNPLDDRSPAWNIWQEGEDSADFDSLASSLMPLHLTGSDPFWINSARTIFSSGAERLRIMNKKNNRTLLQAMFTEN